MPEEATWVIRMHPDAARLILSLGLVPHPEGGFFREVHRSPLCVAPADSRGSRSALTVIYFLLPKGAVSRWHDVTSDELWTFLDGSPLSLRTIDPATFEARSHTLGAIATGLSSFHVVTAGVWQGAESTGDYSLVCCTVGPGFDFGDFRMGSDVPEFRDRLLREHTDLARFL